MQWLNLKTSTLHAPEYIGSEPRARSAWLNVMLWCAQQENGGRIEQARDWKDRQWQQTCGVTRREVDSADRLLQWDGQALNVWNYPADKEHIVREKRDIGRAGGIKSGVARSSKSEPKGEAEAKQTVEPNGQANASTERKGKEEEGKGKEDNTAPVPVALSLRLDQPPTPDKKFNAAEASIPSTIDSPEFRAAWADWCQYRRESGHTMKSRTAHAQLAEMAGWGKVESIAAIRQSIRQGWRGVFKPDANQRKPAQESEFANAF